MFRYYVIATAVVVTFVSVAALFARRGPPLDVASVQSHGTPSAPRLQGASARQVRSVQGAAPWALSALPECFRQSAVSVGSYAEVRSRLPRGARPIVRAVEVRVGDCRLAIAGEGAAIERADDRLVIPPVARFFVAADRLALLRRDGARAELRLYHLNGGISAALRAASGTPGPLQRF